MRDASIRLTQELKPKQSIRHGAADIEAPPVAAHVALVTPPHIAVHLVRCIESAALQQAGSQAQGHRGIIRPFASPEGKRAATDHVLQRLERTSRFELNRSTHRVTDSQPQQTTTKTVATGFVLPRHLETTLIEIPFPPRNVKISS
jgi:hypothetical protein